MSDTDDLIKEFLIESYENLDRLDQDFVALEENPQALDRLDSIFRTIHTIKGTCGFLGLSKLESVSHIGENVLSRLREGKLVMDSLITTTLLKMCDAVRAILKQVETTGTEGDGDYTQLIADLTAIKDGKPAAAPVQPAPAIAATPAVEKSDPQPEPAPAEAPAAKAAPAAPAEGGIRVDVGLLDKLMNLVGELVLARNQVMQFTATQDDAAFLGTTQRLNLITTELQEGVMKTRMQPIGNVWSKFPRIVRDLAKSCGKKVRIEMEGKETELDKTIIEAIKDPLTHIIRNSVDHGVESPEARKAAGKPEEGCLRMRAYHEGGQVNIEICDDGKGIDPERIKAKAVEKGLITPEQAARMSEREATHLVFAAGFSTAEKVTNVSGRGVGMDVVKTNIEKIGGAVDIQSRVGQGTTLKIKIPLTLAIIPGLIVTSGGERFAIPQVSLQELVRVEGGIEFIKDTPVYRLRGKLLPLVYLNHVLKCPDRKDGDGYANIVVLSGGGDRQFGLVVDHINDTEEIVVKPLGKQLKSLSLFAGATIMGDGKVALILDVIGLAQMANIAVQSGETTAAPQLNVASDRASRTSLLLFRLSGGQRMVVPLSAVARLEEFPPAAVEDASGAGVVQYRGQIMPLIDVAERLGDRQAIARSKRPRREADDDRTIQVIVHSRDGRDYGLRIDHIIDVVDEKLDPQRTAARPGVLGTLVIKDKVAEVLDIDYITAATPLRAAA